MLRLKNFDLQTNFSTKNLTKTTLAEVNFSDKFVVPRVSEYMKQFMVTARRRRFLDKGLIVNALRSEYPEYARKSWGVLSNLVGRALVVIDEMDDPRITEGYELDYSEDSTIDLMSTEEEIDIADNLDQESSNYLPLDVDTSETETANTLVPNQWICNASAPNEKTALPTSSTAVDSCNSFKNGWAVSEIKTSDRGPQTTEKRTIDLNNTAGEGPTPPKKIYNSIAHNTSTVDQEPHTTNKKTKYNVDINAREEPATMKKMLKQLGTPKEVTVTFNDLAGCDSVLLELCQLIMHIKHPEIYKTLGVSPLKGFLLHGPPGCGKTLLAKAVAGELQIPLIEVAAPQLVAGISGESEKRLRNLFESAVKSAPCVLFIDEVDSISPPRTTATRDMERRIVAQLLSSLDNLKDDDNVIVIGATNRPDGLDPALRRAGRFDREVCLGIPDRQARKAILELMCKNLQIDPDVNLEKLSELTPGYVGADLKSLIREAATIAAHRAIESLKMRWVTESESEINTIDETMQILSPKQLTIKDTLKLLRSDDIILPDDFSQIKIELNDFKEALKKVVPSSKREGFATVPNITWDDIGSLKKIIQELYMAMLAPVTHAKEFTALGLDVPTGVLLCGPPGCGKTLLAKAVANEANINFISIKGPELLNMYVGESERGVRQCFQRARNSQPCIIFFDEIDALCPKRSDTTNHSGEGVVNQLLTEMDGFESGRSGGVFVIGATNRPDMIDPAVLRPGRLDKVLYVGLPDEEGRVDILRAITKNRQKPVLADDVDLEAIGKNEKCSYFTGADLAALVREAGILCLQEYINTNSLNKQLAIQSKHFDEALLKIRPSVSAEDQVRYECLRREYAAPRC